MWQVEGNWASLRADRLVARVNPRAPRDGLLDVRLDGRLIADARLMQLRGLDASCESDTTDFFARGADLVVQYPARSADGLSCQVYWRSIEFREFNAVGVEVVVSVQTGLLDDVASVVSGSELPCREVLHLLEDGTRALAMEIAQQTPDPPKSAQINRPGPLLYRLADGVSSCIEMVHPTDFLSGQVGCSSPAGVGARSAVNLIGERMEKGVIRRARARTLFLPESGDEAAAVECYRRFAMSESPLTA